jgi:carbonic anhydrase
VKFLKVENIIVLGHAQCGGIAALAVGPNQADQGTFIRKWVTIADEAREQALQQVSIHDFKKFCHCCELEAVKVSIKNLKTFPFIQKRVNEGNLSLSGWYFDLEEGKLWEYSEKSNKFIEL